MAVNKDAHPLTWFWLNADRLDCGKPYSCDECPAGKLVEPYHEVMNDLAEAHYDCALLGERVWGESPKCFVDDWQRGMRKELGIEIDGEVAAPMRLTPPAT